MTKRPIVLLAMLALLLATIGGWQLNNSIAVHAFESSSASTSREQTASPDPKAVTWEYKILTGTVEEFRRALATAGRGPSFVDNLEEDINRLSAQGYVVESFQTSSSVESNGWGISFKLSSSQPIVVLLKRMRK
jgi:hypothetical protein